MPNKWTVNEILRRYGPQYRNQNHLSVHTLKVMRAIEACRTEALGGRTEMCDKCGHIHTLYNSCRNRHCPQCQSLKKERWIADRSNELLPFTYFHAVFTLPDRLNPLVYRNRKVLYGLLFATVKETLLSVSADRKYLGVRTGFFSILHTWGQKLNLHPHLHCVVPGGGYSERQRKWIRCPDKYLLPVEVLRSRFRSLFLVKLKALYRGDSLNLKGTVYEDGTVFQELIDDLFATDWVVYIKEAFENSGSVIKYLAKYTHRIAISNHRIVKMENGTVHFRYKDYAEGNRKKVLSLPVMEFIRRFLNHTVPHRFVRIRYYGLLSHRNKREKRKECLKFFGMEKEDRNRQPVDWMELFFRVTGEDIRKCPKCKSGNMTLYRTIIPDRYRSPPVEAA
jgi:predicted Zn-ribbon and HTH transcriptional regulator